MHRIVFLDRSTIAPQIRLRPPRFKHELIEYERTRPEEVVPRLAGAADQDEMRRADANPSLVRVGKADRPGDRARRHVALHAFEDGRDVAGLHGEEDCGELEH